MIKLSQVLKFLFFLSLGLIILYLIYQNQQSSYLKECALNGIPSGDCNLWDKIVKDFTSAKWAYVFLSVGLYLVSCIIRAIRWNMLTKPLGYKLNNWNALGAVMVGYLANMALPRVGEFVRAGVISKYDKIPADKAIGTIITERIVDFLMLLIAIALMVMFEASKVIIYFKENFSISDKLNSFNIIVFAIIFLAAVLLFVLVYRKYKQALFQSAFSIRINNFLIGLKSGVFSILKLKNPLLFVLYSAAIWFMYFLMTYIGFYSFGPTAGLSTSAALLVFVFGSLGVVFPSPGGMGSYHFLVMQGLALYGVGDSDGFSFANIIFFSVNLIGNVFVGLLFLILLPLLNGKKNHPSENL